MHRLTAPHSAYARDLIAALHAYRLHAWRPERDAYLSSQTDRASWRTTDQVGWVIDLRHLQHPPGNQPRPNPRRTS
ncbi:hypothetical protein [Streptomyces goshikiensis]|uniref:hypothetical protein n=1 Tax=Streptomyces goshikiensis TaxID=1942 RepID=UPI00365BDFDC